MRYQKRCYHYDRRGCLRKIKGDDSDTQCNCDHRYAHPGDLDWDVLPRNHPPRYSKLSRTPSRSPSPPPIMRSSLKLLPKIPTTSLSKPAPTMTTSALPEAKLTKSKQRLAKQDDKSLSNYIKLKAEYSFYTERYKRLQQMVDIDALSASAFSERIPSREKLVLQQNTLEKRLKSIQTGLREWERISPSNTQDPGLESNLTTLRSLLTELRQKLRAVVSLKNKVNANNGSLASAKSAGKDADGNITMESLPSCFPTPKRKQPMDSLSVDLRECITYLQVTFEQVSQHIVSLEDNGTQMIDVIRLQDSDPDEGTSSATRVALNEIDHLVDHICDELSETAQWLTELSAENAAIDAAHQKLAMNTQKEEAETQKLMRRIDRVQRESEKEDNAIDSLSASLTVYLGRSATPSALTFNAQEAAENLEKPILRLVRNALRHILTIYAQNWL
ncbi:hypothetical protein BDP27DRAFT_1516234 [Rhodocollybia butyracea]|uniref:Uncharacterized protein n=1 Tax=Rhodocollybia butyracea TaxID=206335 RepID=A0A9P5U889_9AGAR|nr:hypothetical protein BDP27DRAFT_1516234 [Rhodocollybia butyracea]